MSGDWTLLDIINEADDLCIDLQHLRCMARMTEEATSAALDGGDEIAPAGYIAIPVDDGSVLRFSVSDIESRARNAHVRFTEIVEKLYRLRGAERPKAA